MADKRTIKNGENGPKRNSGGQVRIERELMRGAGPAAVLQLLETREMYGYELVEALSRVTDGVLDMGQSTLYPMLYNLEGKGFIEGHWREAESGRKRKYYGLTEMGLSHLTRQKQQWRELAGAMENLGLLG
jgi:PadR family transcriptional regulator